MKKYVRRARTPETVHFQPCGAIFKVAPEGNSRALMMVHQTLNISALIDSVIVEWRQSAKTIPAPKLDAVNKK